MNNAIAYNTLGLKDDCSYAELRAAWKAFAGHHHSDRGGAAASFKVGLEAYKYLCEVFNTPEDKPTNPPLPIVAPRGVIVVYAPDSNELFRPLSCFRQHSRICCMLSIQ